jgi:alpha-tubulin suppressor-like RCC1 family protein
MALPSTGAISLNDVNLELSKASGATITMNDSNVRTLFGIASGSIDMNTGRGKSAVQKGPVYAWGSNLSGQRGDGTTTDTTASSPALVVGGYTDWVYIAGRAYGFSGVRANGTLFSWGAGTNGMNGNFSISNTGTPVQEATQSMNWKQVFPGLNALFAIDTSGQAYGWGLGTSGQIGDGTLGTRTLPTLVAGGFTDWKALQTGTLHTVGVRNNGTAWAWGLQTTGRLGNGLTSGVANSPVSVVGGFTDWTHIAAGLAHSLGRRSNGTIWSWGSNTSGALGTGNVTAQSSPVSIAGGFTDWTFVIAGGDRSFAIRSNGTAWAWGNNIFATLGDNTNTSRSSPVSIVGGFTDWVELRAGPASNANGSMGRRSNGTVWSWGSSTTMGDGTITAKSSPVSIAGGFTTWVTISAAQTAQAAIKT